jgi:hypothetical protein
MQQQPLAPRGTRLRVEVVGLVASAGAAVSAVLDCLLLLAFLPPRGQGEPPKRGTADATLRMNVEAATESCRKYPIAHCRAGDCGI